MTTEITHLKPGQIRLAEWLALPISERQPKTQTALAEELDVTEATLINWKKSNELWDYRDTILRHAGKDMVPEAMRVVGGILRLAEASLAKDEFPENVKVALEAAKDVMSRWSDPARKAHLVTTLKDIYRDIDKGIIEGEYAELPNGS